MPFPLWKGHFVYGGLVQPRDLRSYRVGHGFIFGERGPALGQLRLKLRDLCLERRVAGLGQVQRGPIGAVGRPQRVAGGVKVATEKMFGGIPVWEWGF